MRDDRKTFADGPADTLAEKVGAGTRLPPGGGRGLRFVWYQNEKSLTLVVGAQEADDADRALAIGLAERGSRELRLVLAAGWHEPTMHRWAWLRDDLPVRVWTHDCHPGAEPCHQDSELGHQVTELARPGRDDSAELVTAVEKPQLHLGDRTPWVADLMRWAGRHLDLDPAHRSGFRAWQCRGQRVLVIRRTREGLQIVAGIDFGPTSPNPTPTPLVLTGRMTDEQLREVTAAVEAGCHERRFGIALRHDEHWLQAALRRRPDALGLEQPVLREVAAWRPRGSASDDPERPRVPRSRGFVDLAGLDALGTLVLVETKLGADDLLVLQGLDYWIWARANRKRLAARLDCKDDVPMEIAYCVGGTGGGDPTLSRHLPAQLDALHPEIRWRLLHVTEWTNDGVPKVTDEHGSQHHAPPDASSTTTAQAEGDRDAGTRARAAMLADIAQAHHEWSLQVESESAPGADTYGFADAGEHYADVVATPEQNAAFVERVRGLSAAEGVNPVVDSHPVEPDQRDAGRP
ncbi:hypothetical protein [Cellulomonas humilata]|uniref:DUF4263 domain-containing protein n=1 Tax=Cellulomonas humilata TaxID=144055 RepID=A0ABU0ELN0_9CELL|nr:hypothetical protein [Cellulomonas humilata]MDQ0375983.1 hypothetical protein [Cellulomonas humilata]